MQKKCKYQFKSQVKLSFYMDLQKYKETNFIAFHQLSYSPKI
jgi:hypothetical protein